MNLYINRDLLPFKSLQTSPVLSHKEGAGAKRCGTQGILRGRRHCRAGVYGLRFGVRATQVAPLHVLDGGGG